MLDLARKMMRAIREVIVGSSPIYAPLIPLSMDFHGNLLFPNDDHTHIQSLFDRLLKEASGRFHATKIPKVLFQHFIRVDKPRLIGVIHPIRVKNPPCHCFTDEFSFALVIKIENGSRLVSHKCFGNVQPHTSGCSKLDRFEFCRSYAVWSAYPKWFLLTYGSLEDTKKSTVSFLPDELTYFRGISSRRLVCLRASPPDTLDIFQVDPSSLIV